MSSAVAGGCKISPHKRTRLGGNYEQNRLLTSYKRRAVTSLQKGAGNTVPVSAHLLRFCLVSLVAIL